MKKIINGKSYDTNTAKEVGYWSSELNRTDFGWCEETLYLKKTGEYFLYGYGHGNSRYGEWHGNTGGSGEKIMPFDETEAKSWAEENLDGEDYEKIFGEVTEEEVTITLRTTANIKEKFDKLKRDKHMNASDLLIFLLNNIEKK